MKKELGNTDYLDGAVAGERSKAPTCCRTQVESSSWANAEADISQTPGLFEFLPAPNRE